MDEEKKYSDDFTDYSEFSKKYNHYINPETSEDFSSDTTPAEESMVFEDISSYSEGNADFYMNPREDNEKKQRSHTAKKNEKTSEKEKGHFFSRNKYRNAKITALVLLIALLLSIGGLFLYALYLTGKGEWGDDGFDFRDPNSEQTIYDDNHDWQVMGDVNADSLNDFLFSWANNGGEKMYSKNVINVLLCGVDSETGEADAGRSDIMMLVSINKKLEKITMVSFLRDSWTYMRVPRKDGTSYDYYFKMNAAYNYGGPATLLQTIENNFKIEIDEFLAVDFKSFPKLIDALGGVTVEVQDYEANFIRRTSSQKDFPYGTATLNGKQALIYSRIRKCDADSDISRTRRQRSVIKGLVDSAKSATKGQLLNAFKQVSGYIRTGYTQTEVFALIAQAFANGWMDYEMVELVLPSEDYVDRASSQINGQWCWIVDYALCAQKLQIALYGESNIVLADDRDSVLDLVTNRREPNSSTTDNDYNDDYNNDSGDDSSGNDSWDDTDKDNSSDSSDSSEDNVPSFTLPSIPIPEITLPGFNDPDSSDDGQSDTENQ